MHLDAAFDPIVDGFMLEACQAKVARQLAVDTRQDIQVERGCGADRIAIGRKQLGSRLNEISAKQKRIAWREPSPHMRKEVFRAGTVEIADGTSQKQHQQRFSASAPR